MAWTLAFVGLALLALLHEVVLRVAAKRWRRSLAIMLAGAAHYVGIAAFAFAFFVSYGAPSGWYTSVVKELAAGYDAEAKLWRGDEIFAIDHVALGADSVAMRVNQAQGNPVLFTVERNGAMRDIELKPTRDTNGHWRVGVRLTRKAIVDRDPARSIGRAFVLPAAWLMVLIDDLKSVVFGEDHADVGGPKRIYDEFVVELPMWQVALTVLLRAAAIALLLQLVLDVLRGRPRRK